MLGLFRRLAEWDSRSLRPWRGCCYRAICFRLHDEKALETPSYVPATLLFVERAVTSYSTQRVKVSECLCINTSFAHGTLQVVARRRIRGSLVSGFAQRGGHFECGRESCWSSADCNTDLLGLLQYCCRSARLLFSPLLTAKMFPNIPRFRVHHRFHFEKIVFFGGGGASFEI